MENVTNATPTLSPEEKAAEAKLAREITLPEKVAGLTPGSLEHEEITWAIRYGSDHLVRSLAAGYQSGHTYVKERIARELPAAIRATDAWSAEDRVSPSEAALDLAAAYRRLGYDASVSWVTTEDRGSREAITIDVPWVIDVPWCREWLIVELPEA